MLECEAPKRSWKPGHQQHSRDKKLGQSEQAESTQGADQGVMRQHACKKGS